MDQRGDGTRADLEARVERERDGKLRSLIAQQAALANRVSTRPTGDKGDLYRTMGDGFTRAVELALTPVIFGALGYGLDRWLGTKPVFLTIFFLLAIIGMLLRTWYGYAYRMEALEQDLPWNRQPADGAPAATGTEVPQT